MSYGLKYEIIYKNRFQRDIYRTEIWEKDFTDYPTELTGAENAFEAEWTSGDTDILTSIKTLQLTISFLSRDLAQTYDLSIEDFYSDDDEQFRVDHYFQSYEDGSGTEKLLYSGYLIEDGATEPLTDRKHVITLKATDNLALLKNVTWDQIGAEFDGFFGLGYYVRYCLEQTGLYASATSIPMSLPLRIYDNLFENTIDDRSDDPQADPYHQIVLNSGLFKNSDGTWKSCYDVLDIVLRNMNASICQANGCWNVFRIPEYSLFPNGAIPGTEYIYNGSGTDITEVFLDDAVEIDGLQVRPIAEDQVKGIQRPLRNVTNNFNYNIPPWIIGGDLQLPEGATPYNTTIIGDFQYDDYSLATYFPDWVQRNGDTSYLQVVTNTVEQRETDRYILMPGQSVNNCGIQFNPIPVTAGDIIHGSFQFRTDDSDPTFRVYIRFALVRTNDTVRTITTGGTWATAFACADFDTGNYLPMLGLDTNEYQQYDLDTLYPHGQIPDDGVLLIQINGASINNGEEHPDIKWNNLNISFENFTNQQSQIIGQSHSDTGTSTIKATEESDIQIDDTQANIIGGTLFTDAVTTFCAGIGNIFFTRTEFWHRAEIVEALRLGNILTQERIRLRYTSRAIVEGTFRNLRYDAYSGDGFISLLSLFKFGSGFTKYTDKNFAPMSMSLNYMSDTFNARLVEIFKDGETDITEILNTDADVTTYSTTGVARPIAFTSAITQIDFAPDGSFIVWTYSGITAPVDIELKITGVWTATDVPAILNLKVNGVVVASYSIGDGNPANTFSQILTFSTTLNPTDEVSASVDWVGAHAYSLEIQTGSYLKVNRFTIQDTYLFNYIYQQN